MSRFNQPRKYRLNKSLTAKQEKVLVYIRDFTESFGTPPTLRELCHHMGYKAIGSAQDIVGSLRRKGYLKAQTSQRARSLLVTEKGWSHGRRIEDLSPDINCLTIPCLGSIPAGDPIEAIEDSVGTLRISKSSFGDNLPSISQLFALQAVGDSMIGAGIHDGDWLVVERHEEADVGEIVVARISDTATVKRLKLDDDGYYLMPENDKYEPIYGKDEPFEIIGKVIALQRTLH